jgi:uncharacterized protein involved in oxidation of intracellular sulfur
MEPILFVVNGPAYGTENAYNALRLARTLIEKPEVHIRMFLIGDAVTCARKEQKPPTGYYNLAMMLAGMVEKGAEIGACGVCMDARGIGNDDLVSGIHRSTMNELADWTIAASKVVSF